MINKENDVIMIERELKKIIKQDEYKSLLSVFAWSEIKNQTNFYYDVFPPNDNEKITVRIRTINGQNKLQIKCALQNSDKERLEFEEEVPEISPFISSGRIKSLSGFHYDDVFLIGALVTQRNIYNWNSSIIVCLDKNEYLGTTDYELEIEYKDNVESDLLLLLSTYGITFNTKQQGKFSRYINRYYNIRTV